MPDDQIRVVAFDAVGTLMYPEPSVDSVYFDIGLRHGSKLTKDEIKSRFGHAFQVFDRDNAAHEFRTSEARELELWREVVTTVLTDVDSPDACFKELWQWFATVDAWRLFDDVGNTFAALRSTGISIAIASNFDHRLHAICDGFPELESAQIRCVSSEAGYRKPSRGYYHRLAELCGCKPGEILMVGDTPLNDVEGAIDAGLLAVLIDRSQVPDALNRIQSLQQVVSLVTSR